MFDANQADTRRANDRDGDNFRIVAEREMSGAANSRDGKRTAEWEPRLPRGPVLLYTVELPHSRFSYRYDTVERKSDQRATFRGIPI